MSSKNASGFNHCSLKQYLKNTHNDYYKLLKNTFCAGFIFNESNPKTILIPDEELLRSIIKESKENPKEAFNSIKQLVFDHPYEISDFNKVQKVSITNLMHKVLENPEAVGKKIKEVNMSRWYDEDDKYLTKKQANKSKIYLYSGSELPKSSKQGKGVNGGSHVKDDESINVYTVINNWFGKLLKTDEKKIQLEAETYAVSVLLFIQDKDEKLFESISKYIVGPNPVITLYGCLLLLNTEKLEQLKPVVEAFSLKNPGSYAAMIKSLKHTHGSDHEKIVKELIGENNPYDMYASLMHYYEKELKGSFEGVSTIPEKKRVMLKLMLDELQFNDHKNNKSHVSHELVDDLVCNVKLAYAMQNHNSLYNPVVLNGLNYTYGADNNQIIKKDVNKYLIEFIKSDYFLYVNDASNIVVGGTDEDKNYNLSMLKDLQSRIEKMIDTYEHCEVEEKKGEGLAGGRHGHGHGHSHGHSHNKHNYSDSESDSDSD